MDCLPDVADFEEFQRLSRAAYIVFDDCYPVLKDLKEIGIVLLILMMGLVLILSLIFFILESFVNAVLRKVRSRFCNASLSSSFQSQIFQEWRKVFGVTGIILMICEIKLVWNPFYVVTFIIVGFVAQIDYIVYLVRLSEETNYDDDDEE